MRVSTDFMRISLQKVAEAFGIPEYGHALHIMRLSREKRLQGLIMAAEGEHSDSAAQRALRSIYDEDIALAYLELADFQEDWHEAPEGVWNKVVIADAGIGSGYSLLSGDGQHDLAARSQAAVVWAYDVAGGLKGVDHVHS